MATTTNYGWTTPDDTALVKDGASAIRTLGSSVDTTTKNLNPETTLGDISFRSSTSNVNTRLGIGSTSQVLTVTGGVPVWATPAGGTGMTLLSTTTLSGSTTTISSIDQTYKNLEILVYGVTLSGDGSFSFRPNASSTITDRTQVFNEGGTSGTTGAVASQITSGVAATNMLSSDADNIWVFTINNYANTTNYKSIQFTGRYVSNGSVACVGTGGGGIKTNSAISSIAFNSGANTMSTGTVLIYGVK